MFNLVSKYKPRGDQPEAIKELVDGINKGQKSQVLITKFMINVTFYCANYINSSINNLQQIFWICCRFFNLCVIKCILYDSVIYIL